ncbi:MAG TPA: cyanophycinase [Candidatus Eremiobacteraceae bacterium]
MRASNLNVHSGKTIVTLLIAGAILAGGTPVRADANLTVYARVGNPMPSDVVPHGPGLILMGGGNTVDPAFAWMHDTIVGSHWKRGGDIVVLTASSGDEYTDYIMKIAPFNSVRSIQIGPDATQADLKRAASYVDVAQGVFFSGGDQAHYVKWKGSALIAAVQRVYDRGGVVGGTSAGLAILGEYAFDAVAEDKVGPDVNTTTANAMADPSESIISFTHDLFEFPPMRGILTETHLVTRNRLGRFIVFLARLSADSKTPLLGVGLNEHSALVVDRNGVGTLMLEHHSGEALLVRLTKPAPIAKGIPFSAHKVLITVLDREGQKFDFRTWHADARSSFIDVDGSKPPYYTPADPYVPPTPTS